MDGPVGANDPVCWCGKRAVGFFSPDYVVCRSCGTLASLVGLRGDQIAVRDDDRDFYGKTYWLGHQTDDLGLPDVTHRARADMPERCMHWLRTLLRYKHPPGRVLDVGCAHGGFVALLRSLGYDAAGVELSPWVADFAQRTFGVSLHVGPLENQLLPEGSLDAVVLNDVLEHLADPAATVRRCVALLKEDGALVVQTPCFPEHLSYAEMRAGGNRFLEMMDGLARQHLYLFSRRSMQRLFKEQGLAEVKFLPALFSYDMYAIAARRPLAPRDFELLASTLASSAEGRVTLAWLDLLRECEAVEADRAARLEQIHRLHDLLHEAEAARAALEEKNRLLAAAVPASDPGAAGRRKRAGAAVRVLHSLKRLVGVG
jgi:2-polyprenyl-3-methyl-5-hydroxy-6-metoxy-1,4-benzoquinol methylase